MLLTSPRGNDCALVEAVQLAITSLGGNNNGTLPVSSIVIAPSPAVATSTSTSTSSLANPSMSPWDMADVVDAVHVGLAEIASSDRDTDHSHVASVVVLVEVDPDAVSVRLLAACVPEIARRSGRCAMARPAHTR